MRKTVYYLIIIVFILFFCSFKIRPLHTGFYTWKQLQRRGYTTDKFKGSRYIQRTKDSAKQNIFIIKTL